MEQKDRGDKSNTRKLIKHVCVHDSQTFDENLKLFNEIWLEHGTSRC